MLVPSVESILLSDGYRAAVRWWRPGRPRGAVLYFHGIQSHGGWYEQSGRLLAEGDLAVLMPDRRGSGMNQHQRGHVASVEQCLSDAQELLETLVTESGFSSVHVVGVSWGGKLSVALAGTAPARVRTLSLVAPGLFPRIDLATTDKFRVAMAMMNDRHHLFDIPLNDPHLFTSNPARLAFLEGDTLMLRQVSASFLLASRHLDRHVRRFPRSGWRGGVHLLLAGRDKVIDNDRTRQWFESLPSPDRQLSEYPPAEHTIEFEEDASRFYQDLTSWIAARCGEAP
ncbi:MAG TPA: alpha/beta fold hydrolase [Phycisphaerae bacterium]|nr:alpha/beta fold hydrolase [Phycisphaerae bacterium]